MKKYLLLIDGKHIDTGIDSTIMNPSNNTALASVTVSDDKAIDEAIESSRNAADTEVWSSTTIGKRKTVLKKIAAGILEHAAELAHIETAMTGKPIKETTFMDIPSSANAFEYVGENLESLLAGERRAVHGEANAHLAYEPYGVALLIIPWNYPLLIASWKLASALGAGNAVVLKPSGRTPLSAMMLADIIKESGAPDGTVNCINAGGPRLGHRLFDDKRIDLISFTGSNAVAREIMGASSGNIKKMIFELGGKSAGIVFRDSDLATVVNSSLASVFLNQGQMCTAMSRIMVEEEMYDSFVSEFVIKTGKLKIGPGEDFQTQIGPLMSVEHREKIIDFIRNAEQDGAVIACGGSIPEGDDYRNGIFFEPTVITGVCPEMQIVREEVFGPVVCISKFSSDEAAIGMANDSDYGLAACIWNNDVEHAEKIASRLHAGIVWINTYGMFYNELPYGGFKKSGFGKELGKEGFREYCRQKTVIADKSEGGKPLVSYWYGF